MDKSQVYYAVLKKKKVQSKKIIYYRFPFFNILKMNGYKMRTN